MTRCMQDPDVLADARMVAKEMREAMVRASSVCAECIHCEVPQDGWERGKGAAGGIVARVIYLMGTAPEDCDRDRLARDVAIRVKNEIEETCWCLEYAMFTLGSDPVEDCPGFEPYGWEVD